MPYHDVLVNFPFKGDEGALRGMEQAELIAITAHDGTPRSALSSVPSSARPSLTPSVAHARA